MSKDVEMKSLTDTNTVLGRKQMICRATFSLIPNYLNQSIQSWRWLMLNTFGGQRS